MLLERHVPPMLNTTDLRRICKGIAAMEIIIAEEEYLRCYYYNADWNEGKELFELNDGGENHMFIFFKGKGAVICGINDELYDWENDIPDIKLLTKNLPQEFHELVFNEPVKSIKATFCLWTVDGKTWEKGHAHEEHFKDGSKKLLKILDGNPQTYVNYCNEYYGKDIPIETVEKFYKGDSVTLDMIGELEGDRDDIEGIKKDLIEIKYPENL